MQSGAVAKKRREVPCASLAGLAVRRTEAASSLLAAALSNRVRAFVSALGLIPLDFVAELFVDFVDLGLDDRLAIAGKGILGKVVLVIGFGLVKDLGRLHVGDDLAAAVNPRLVEFGDELQGLLLLRFAVIKNHAPVLRPHVVALAVLGGRIVDLKEDF